MLCSAQVPVALQKLLDIGPVFNGVHKLCQPWVVLETIPSILNQLLVMADLVDDKIGICDLITNDKGT